jgi:hypothetical protein
MVNAAGQVSEEDFAATADYYDRLLTNTSPQIRAEGMALEQFWSA